MNPPRGHVDQPQPDDRHRSHRIPVSGWVYLDEGRQDDLQAVLVTSADGSVLARTRLFFDRPDVAAHLGLTGALHVGFETHAALPDGACPDGGETELCVALELRGASGPVAWQRVRATLHADDLHTRAYGHVLRPSTLELLHRDDIYRTGPPSHAVNGEILALLLRYLPSRGRVLDAGCGVGPFGKPLMERGFEWFGVEIRDEDCREMARAGLPHRQVVPDAPLPFGDGAFDGGMCLEVLEHVARPGPFLAELSRVVRGRTVFSVPNFEVVPLVAARHMTPWHMLEPDHKNFFTRFSLGHLLGQHFRNVEILDYARLPLGELLPETLPYHLLAVADNFS